MACVSGVCRSSEAVSCRPLAVGRPDREVLLSADYKEEQLRLESGPSPTIRHSYFVIRTSSRMPVIHEESIKACPELGRRVAGATNAPDHTFAAFPAADIPLRRFAA